MLGGFPCEASFLGRPRLILVGQMLHMYCGVYRYLIMLWHFYVRTRCPRSDSPGSSPTTFGLSDESGYLPFWKLQSGYKRWDGQISAGYIIFSSLCSTYKKYYHTTCLDVICFWLALCLDTFWAQHIWSKSDVKVRSNPGSTQDREALHLTWCLFIPWMCSDIGYCETSGNQARIHQGHWAKCITV